MDFFASQWIETNTCTDITLSPILRHVCFFEAETGKCPERIGMASAAIGQYDLLGRLEVESWSNRPDAFTKGMCTMTNYNYNVGSAGAQFLECPLVVWWS